MEGNAPITVINVIQIIISHTILKISKQYCHRQNKKYRNKSAMEVNTPITVHDSWRKIRNS